MPVIKKLSALTSIKRKSPTDRLPTGYLNNDSVTSAMIRNLAVQTRHLEFILSGGTGVTYSLPSRIFGVTTSATAYQFVRFNGTSFVAAQANNTANGAVVGVLVPNQSGSAVDVVTQGVVNGFSGLVTNSVYYLSPSIPGAITATIPTSGVLTSVGRALSPTSMLVNIEQSVKTQMELLPFSLVAPNGFSSGTYASPAAATFPNGIAKSDVKGSFSTTVSVTTNVALNCSASNVFDYTYRVSSTRTIPVHNLSNGQTITVLVTGVAGDIVSFNCFSDAGVTAVTSKVPAYNSLVMSTVKSVYNITRVTGSVDWAIIAPLHGLS